MPPMLDDNLERCRLRRGVEIPRTDVAPSTTIRWLGALQSSLVPDKSAYAMRGDAILSGRLALLDGQGNEGRFPPDWQRGAHDNARQSLRQRPATATEFSGDAGRLRNLHRHAEAVALAQAWYLTGATRFSDGLLSFLWHWLQQCPYPIGAGWSSALESGNRLLNWSVTWQLIGGEDSPLFDTEPGRQLRRAWVDSVFVHARHVRRNYSRDVPANDRLVAELVGLYAAATTWPLWMSLRRWGEAARRELDQQLFEQIPTDGTCHAHSVDQCARVFSLYAIVHAVGQARGQPLIAAQLERLHHAIACVEASHDRAALARSVNDSLCASLQALDANNGDLVCIARALAHGMGLSAQRTAEQVDAPLWLFGSPRSTRRTTETATH